MGHPPRRVPLSRIAKSVLELIGNTPLVRLRALETPGSAQVLAKLEGLNPSGSTKDRAALAMIEDAESRSKLRSGMTIIEPTGGNMGISLALVGAAKGYRVAITMPESVPLERRRLVTRFGATVHLTPARLGMAGAIQAARRMLDQDPMLVMLGQFTNPANAKAHREGTGKEILEATSGRVDAFVAGVGTGGTITGVGAALKAVNPSVLVVAVEPDTSPLLSQGHAGDHGIVGIGADFVPPLLNRGIIDEIVAVVTKDAIDATRRLAQEMGLLVGISSGANVLAALRVAQRLGEDKVVVTVLPDTGERYPMLNA
ncbi:MAG: cysteine synthase A [Dehalococcoidia bacterium]|nr:cysteine synthase A [Dehalococcoidia bacterium]